MIKRATTVLVMAALTGVAAVPAAQAGMRHQAKPCATNATVSKQDWALRRGVSVEAACPSSGGSDAVPVRATVSFEELAESIRRSCDNDIPLAGQITTGRGVASAGGSAAASACYLLRMYGGSGGGGSTQVAAARAVANLDIVAPEIGLTGYGRPESMQLLGLPTWMWVADPGASTTGPVVSTGTDGGVTVTATGAVRKTVWDMGDGGTVTCSGQSAAGTPYDRAYGGLPSPTCGYRYDRTSAYEPGRAFTVSVTVYWDVTWSGGGQSGVLATSVTRQTQLRVGEVQVLTDERGTGKK